MPASGTQFELPPVGIHPAYCFGLIDLGTQMRKGFQGKPDKPAPKLMVKFELAIPEKRGDGNAFVITKKWWASSNEKATMRKDIEVWRGKKFASDKEAQAYDLSKALGMKCMLNIQHDEWEGKEFAKIVAIMPAIAGLPFEAATQAIQKFELAPGFDAELLESFPDFLRAEIKSSPEYGALVSGVASGGRKEQNGSSGLSVSASELAAAKQAVVATQQAQLGLGTQAQTVEFVRDEIPF